MLINGANGRLRLFRLEPLAVGPSAISAAVALCKKYGFGDRGRRVATSMGKLKGYVNPTLPIRASVSEDGRLAVCGSEDGAVHVWDSRTNATFSARELEFCSFFRPCVVSLLMTKL